MNLPLCIISTPMHSCDVWPAARRLHVKRSTTDRGEWCVASQLASSMGWHQGVEQSKHCTQRGSACKDVPGSGRVWPVVAAHIGVLHVVRDVCDQGDLRVRIHAPEPQLLSHVSEPDRQGHLCHLQQQLGGHAQSGASRWGAARTHSAGESQGSPGRAHEPGAS